MAQWLRCCATNRKVPGSIPDDVIGIFHWNNPADRTMALGSTQPLTEMSTRRNFLGVSVARAYGWQPYHLPVPLSWNLKTLTSWNPVGNSRSVTGQIYLYLLRKQKCTSPLINKEAQNKSLIIFKKPLLVQLPTKYIWQWNTPVTVRFLKKNFLTTFT